MPRALIINPNTSTSVTDMLMGHVGGMLGPAWMLGGITASFGAEYIASEAAYAIATHAALDAYALACEAGEPDAILIGCFGDPGLEALREIANVPVIGLAESAMIEAAGAGRFAIVTGGPRWAAILQRRAAAAGLAARFAGSFILEESGAELAADRDAAIAALGEACKRAIAACQPAAIILGGAALAGIGDVLAAQLGLPVIDSVSAAARALQASVTQAATTAGPDGVRYKGISLALEQALRKNLTGA